MILKVKGQELKIDNAVISQGAINYVTFELKCDKSWKRLNKTVRFRHLDGETIYDVPNVREGSACYVPQEVLKKGKVAVGVVGVKKGDTVVTTTEEYFEVMASIDGGKTPRIKPDAYAEYVNTVITHTRECKKAEKRILEAEKTTLRLRQESETFFIGAKNALAESKEILQQVSGAVDAIGVALRDIRKREEGLFSLDRKISQKEEERELSERERDFKDRQRDERERERQECEKDRSLSETGRINGERVRCYTESERERTFLELDKRINHLEEKREVYLEKKFFDDCAELSKSESIENFSLTPKEEVTSAFISPCINSEVKNIPLGRGLVRIEKVSDEVVFEKERTYVLRRFFTLTLDGGEEIAVEDSVGERGVFVIPFYCDGIPEGTIGESNHFIYGKGNDGERVWVSGNYLFFSLPSSLYESKKDLSLKLTQLKKEGTPATVTFSLSQPYQEELPFTYFDDKGICVCLEGYSIGVTVVKNIFSTLSELIKKIETLEKSFNEKENKNELETKTLIT